MEECLSSFTTIAAQLIQQEASLAPYVKGVIDNDPTIFEKALKEQFEKLILEPLSHIENTNTLVIVIDALDECDGDKNVRLLIDLLSRANELKSPRLRIFLTSRPELPIRLGFHDVRGTFQHMILHKVEQSIIEHDLTVYFKHELANVRKDYNNSASQQQQLPSTWPEQWQVQTLVQLAIPLFIFAATTCRFLADRRTGTPDKKLQSITGHQTKSQISKLDATYSPVLEQLLFGLSNSEQNEVLRLFKRLVGSIILLTSPLSTSALARLLDISLNEIENQLDFLHSVLNIPSSPNLPVRLLHLSFRDFLLDSSKCSRNPFWIDEKEVHKRLAADCLRVMSETFCTDICKVKWLGTHLTSIDPQVIADKLRPEVRYACQYWAQHVEQAGDRVVDDNQVHRFLKQHFLHWLEASVFIEEVWACVWNIGRLRTLLQSQNSTEVSNFLNNALDFAYDNMSIIRELPLHIYSLALISRPKARVNRTTFQGSIPDWVYPRPNVNVHWTNCLEPRDGHTFPVKSVAFSPDGKMIALGSADSTVQLWSAATGECLQTFDDHTGWVNSVAFSPDGKTVVSASYDKTVRLWLVATGECLKTLDGHTESVNSAAFSPDGKTIASASYDRTVRLWSAITGKYWQTLNGHTNCVYSVAFSPDGKIVASGSDDKTVRLWSAATGKCFRSIDIGIAPYQLSFGLDNRTLYTEAGAISFSDLPQLTQIETVDMGGPSALYSVRALPDCDQECRVGYGISKDCSWITLNGKILLCLPEDCRPGVSAVFGTTIAIGTGLGTIVIIRFPTEGLSRV